MGTQVQTISEITPPAPHPDRLAPMQLWDVITRNRYFILGGFAVALTAAGLFAWLAPPVFESSTSLRIDDNRNGVPALEVLAILSDKGDELSTEIQMLKSRTLAEATVDSLGLQAVASGPLKIAGISLPGFRRVIARSSVLTVVRVARTTPVAHYRLNQLKDYSYEMVDRESGKTLRKILAGQLVERSGLQFSLAPSALRYRSIDLDVSPFQATVTSMSRHLSVTRPQRDAQKVLVK